MFLWFILSPTLNCRSFKFKNFQLKVSFFKITVLTFNPVYSLYGISYIFKLSRVSKYLHYIFVVLLAVWSVGIIQYQYIQEQIPLTCKFNVLVYLNKLFSGSFFLQVGSASKELALCYFWQASYSPIYTSVNIGLLFIIYLAAILLLSILFVEFELRQVYKKKSHI